MENSLWGGSLPLGELLIVAQSMKCKMLSFILFDKVFPHSRLGLVNILAQSPLLCLLDNHVIDVFFLFSYLKLGAHPIPVSVNMYLSEEILLWIGLSDWLSKLFLFPLR
jgi:hypothetical protein